MIHRFYCVFSPTLQSAQVLFRSQLHMYTHGFWSYRVHTLILLDCIIWLANNNVCMWWGASKLLVSLVSRILRNSPSAWLILLLLPLPWTLTSHNHDHYPRRGMTHNSSGCSTIQSPNLHGGVKIQLATYNAIMWTSKWFTADIQLKLKTAIKLQTALILH